MPSLNRNDEVIWKTVFPILQEVLLIVTTSEVQLQHFLLLTVATAEHVLSL